MPTHDLLMDIPEKVVLHKDVTIEVHSDGVKLGQLQISKGSIDWWPGKTRTNGCFMTWERFDQVMKAYRDKALRID